MDVLSRTQRPSLSFSVAANIFLLAFLGPTIYLNVYFAGLAYTSATVASALSNVIPALTFLMEVLLGYILCLYFDFSNGFMLYNFLTAIQDGEIED